MIPVYYMQFTFYITFLLHRYILSPSSNLNIIQTIQTTSQSSKSDLVKIWDESHHTSAESTHMAPHHIQCNAKFHSGTSKALSYLLLPDPHQKHELPLWWYLFCLLSSSPAGILIVSSTRHDGSALGPQHSLPSAWNAPSPNRHRARSPVAFRSRPTAMFSVRLSLAYLSIPFRPPAQNFSSPFFAFFSPSWHVSLWKRFTLTSCILATLTRWHPSSMRLRLFSFFPLFIPYHQYLCLRGMPGRLPTQS